jgi:hypothetical protein
MIDRCTNENKSDYPSYGGRGIFVCERWKTFEAFLEDMGLPEKGMTLDRIDVNGPYCPENCRWADQKTQQRNRRNNKWICVAGVNRLLIEWSELNKIPAGTIRSRIRDGWSLEDAVTKPSRYINRNSGKESEIAKINREIAQAW